MRRSFPADQQLVEASLLVVLPGEDGLLTVPDDDLRRGEDLAVSHQVAGQRCPVSPPQHDVKVAGLARESPNQRADLEMFVVSHNLQISEVTPTLPLGADTDLVIAVSWGVTGQAECCPGEGATAGQDEGSLQSVLLHVVQQGGLELGPRAQSERVDGEGAGAGGGHSPD